MTVAAFAEDPFDVRRSVVGSAILQAFSSAGVLTAADVHTAVTLGRLASGIPGDAIDAVVLAAALAVRAVRLGHVFVDLATVAATATTEDDQADLDLSTLSWPSTDTWAAQVAESSLTSFGPDGPADRPLRLILLGHPGSPAARLYLDRYWRHERTIARELMARRVGARPAVSVPALVEGLDRLFPTSDNENQDQPRLAATTALARRMAVVAGGPGTGKTTTVARILALLHEQAATLGEPAPRIALAAPTGKAAARLAEAVHTEAGRLDISPHVRAALMATPASTLHRLLGFQPGNTSRFRHDATNQLPHNVVIVDECSMVSLSMMAKLLVAVRPTARLVLVGDPQQLASVEAGAVLGDIVGEPTAAAAVPVVGPDGVVVLRRVHRYGAGIAALAAAIETGDPDGVIQALRTNGDDITWIDRDNIPDPGKDPQLHRVRQAIVATASAVVAAAHVGNGVDALHHLRAVQVLCAHRTGTAGAAQWRAEIERWLRASLPGYGGARWFCGRPLLVTENDYGLGVFNGDTGVIVDVGGGQLRAVFERRGMILAVRPTRLVSVESLYAMTIHKAQGSQFDSVVVVLPEPSSRALSRELLYTAVTRARTSLTLVASEAAVIAAVCRPIARASGLGDALRSSS